MKTVILIFFLFNSLFAQNLEFVSKLGNFQSAYSFDIDLNKNIYVVDIESNNVIKYDSLGNELINIGGYGWNESTFDEPVSIFTNTLSVYIADKNNNRIQRFDKDLNYLSQYSGNNADSEVEFAYPTVIEISTIGDLFLLETDNNRILKYNLNGEYITEIGGNDAGNYSIDDPVYFTLDKKGNLFVLDGKEIKVFDQFGNSQYRFSPNLLPNKIYSIDNSLLLIYKNHINIFNLLERKESNSFYSFPNLSNDEIIDAKIVDSNLFLLTSNKIIKYKILLKN